MSREQREEESVGHLHDVGFVDGVNLLAIVVARVLESEFRDARAGLLRDDLQALDHAGNDFVLDAGIETLGILTNDDEVDIGITGGHVW